MFKWKLGRQNSGYWRKTFVSLKFFDFHLLKIPEGIEVPPHYDPIKYGKHFRLNISLTLPTSGGIVSGEEIFKTKRIMFFRPDIIKHSMSKIEAGESLIMSVGFIVPNWRKV